MLKSCTCGLTRSLAQQSSAITRRRCRIDAVPVLPNVQRRQTRRSLSSTSSAAYPRKATPFKSNAVNEPYEEDVADGQETNLATSAASGGELPWYMQEETISQAGAGHNVASSSASAMPKDAPQAPSALPTFLKPLWDHLYESPFLDQESISFIDARTVDANVAEHDMDASVSSWVDWVVVTSLRNGRERGIAGASDGIKLAMKDCLKVFDTELAHSEGNTSPTRKKRIPPVMVEGLDVREPQWCLVDGGKAVIHIMTEDARRTWQVEGVASGFARLAPQPKSIPQASV